MKIKSKFVSMLCGLGMLATVGMTTLTVNAEAVTPVPVEVNYVTTMTSTDTPYAFSKTFVNSLDAEEAMFTFTLQADSYVLFGATADPRNASVEITSCISSNPIGANPEITNGKLWTSGTKLDTQEASGILKAGTYFVKMVKTDRGYDGDEPGECVTTAVIKAVPLVYVMNPTVTPSTDYKSATISLNSSLTTELQKIQYVAGGYSAAYDNNATIWNPENLRYIDCEATQLQAGEQSFTVNKNGKYTVRFALDGNVVYSQVIDVNCIDKSAPKITGVKNKKTYKKPVTIKVKDSNSGIKKITLNGKKIKSTKKITKPGKYKVVAIDKAGNKKTITFTIKK